MCCLAVTGQLPLLFSGSSEFAFDGSSADVVVGFSGEVDDSSAESFVPVIFASASRNRISAISVKLPRLDHRMARS